MMIPAFPTLPEAPSVLSPLQQLGKLSGFRGLGLYGLGCGCSEVDDSGNCLDPGPCSTPIDVTNLPVQSTGLNPIYESIPTGTLTLPSTGTPGATVPSSTTAAPTGLTPAQQAALAQTLITGGFGITKEAIAQPGMVIGPNGQISYQNPGYPVGSSAAITTPSSSTFMLLALVGVGAFVLMGARGR